MSLLIFTPYGSYSPETGLLFALARYLHSRGYGLINMRCNGALLSCGRDGNAANRRSVLTCIQCMNDSEAITRWAEIPSLDLSPLLSTAILRNTRKSWSMHSTDHLSRCSLMGLN